MYVLHTLMIKELTIDSSDQVGGDPTSTIRCWWSERPPSLSRRYRRRPPRRWRSFRPNAQIFIWNLDDLPLHLLTVPVKGLSTGSTMDRRHCL